MEKSATIPICYHCGDRCESLPFYFDSKPFCCNGCKSVFQILTQHNLNHYYNIDRSPGIKIKKQGVSDYNFLGVEEIANPFIEFTEGEISVVRILLPSIHCASCIWLLENLNRIHKGVISSQINFLKKEALVSFNIQEISLQELATLLHKIGYPPQFEAAKKKQVVSNNIYAKLGLTFFCFGNIMLFSFPEYLNPDKSFLQTYRNFFSHLIFIFSIPILLYAAKDYLHSACVALKNKVLNLDVPISIGIVTLYMKSVYDIFSGHGPGYMDSFAGFILFLLIGKWFQEKTYQALSFERDYNSYFPLAITQLVNGKEVVKKVKEVVKGNTLSIKNDEIIPTDAVLKSETANIDYSFVTGESTPIKKRRGEQLYAGGRQIGQSILVEVVRPLDQSYLTQLWNQHIFKKEERNIHHTLNDRLSKYFILIVLLVAATSTVIWSFIDHYQVINVLVSVLIVSCPCALALSIPFTFGNAIRIAGENQLYLKNTNVIEKLAKVTDIVFDKTGTLTLQNQSSITFVGQKLIHPQQQMILSLVKNSSHPLSRTLYNHLKKNLDAIDSITHFKEVPGKGIYGKVWNKEVYIGSKEWVESSAPSSSLSTCVYVKIDGKILGYYRLNNKYRSGFETTIASLKKMCKLHLLSGDNESEKQHLLNYFTNKNNILFNQQPMDKLNYVKSLQDDGAVVMMVGDGLNDAGALKQSDIGFVIAEDVYNFTPACDGILDAKRFHRISDFIRLGKYALSVLKISYAISLLYNVIGLTFAITNQLSPIVAAILMPLSSISIVIITTLLIRGYGRVQFSTP